MKYVYVEHWTTIAVTALPPGWFNVYGSDNEPSFSEVCPALLLQEHRETSHAGEERNVTREKLPYDTRVVYAAGVGDAEGTLSVASEASNYLLTEYRGT